MPRTVGRICSGFYLAVSLGVSYVALGSPIALENPGLGDLPYFALIGLHFLWGIVLVLGSGEHRTLSAGATRRRFFVPELLAAASLLFFLFSYIFATNANMDYVQRFITSGGNLRLALDTQTERLHVWYRVGPLVALDLGVYLFLRFVRYRSLLTDTPGIEPDRVVRPWAFALTLISAFGVSVAMPSFLSLEGYPYIGWVALVPVLLVLRTTRPGHAIFYGVVFGSFQTLLASYWLGTFSLVSLQITVFFFLIYYLVFTPLAVHIHRASRWARVLVFPLAWTLLEYLRSTGFLGYPWALFAHSQYAVIPVIQTASITGVWGVSFLVLLANSAIAEFLGSVFCRFSVHRAAIRGPAQGQFGAEGIAATTTEPAEPRSPGSGKVSPRELHASSLSIARSAWWLLGAAVSIGAIVGVWALLDSRGSPTGEDSRVVRVAQVQQNNDPRKHEYDDTLATLQRLTDEALRSDPALVVWSETAFVPNIRRWADDTSSRRYHRLVTEMLAYQAGLQTWLVTGNDDYELVTPKEGGATDRLEYNAAVLFSDTGTREQTYRKIQLVPFTEYFPYRDSLPWFYDLLLKFDVHFWEPGTEQTVFEHPRIRFSTPICYEDVFPNYVRGFVQEGAEAIFNISNDYWSLTEVQAKQHFVAGLFRAVENRRPVLRTTASGLTGQIDARGRIIQTAPYYEEAFIVSDVTIENEQPLTIYTRFGDYFPLAAGGMLVVIWISSLIAAAVRRRRHVPEETLTAETMTAEIETGASVPDAVPRPPSVGETEAADVSEPSADSPPDDAAVVNIVETPAAGSPGDGDGDMRPQETTDKASGRRARRPQRRKKSNWKDIWDR